MTSTTCPARPMPFRAAPGTSVAFRGATATVGDFFPCRLHPSGVRFDGDAVVVAAWVGPFCGPNGGDRALWVDVVAPSDPTRRVVTVPAAVAVA